MIKTMVALERDSRGSSLFDDRGRRVATAIGSAVYSAIRHRFACAQPPIDYAAIHRRLSTHLRTGTPPTLAEFESRAAAILEGIKSDPRTALLTAAVGVPFFLPRVPGASSLDIGRSMDDLYIPAVKASFEEQFPAYRFDNHHKAGLAGKLGIARGSRHDRLLRAMEDDAVIGYYFVALPAFSLPAALEQMEDLPETFTLAGGFDTSAALIGSPSLLLKTDGYPPLLWLAALMGEKMEVGYHYEAYGYNLAFNRRAHLGHAAEYWAAGLVVTG